MSISFYFFFADGDNPCQWCTTSKRTSLHNSNNVFLSFFFLYFCQKRAFWDNLFFFLSICNLFSNFFLQVLWNSNNVLKVTQLYFSLRQTVSVCLFSVCTFARFAFFVFIYHFIVIPRPESFFLVKNQVLNQVQNKNFFFIIYLLPVLFRCFSID